MHSTLSNSFPSNNIGGAAVQRRLLIVYWNIQENSGSILEYARVYYIVFAR